jgi:hypothetical protein
MTRKNMKKLHKADARSSHQPTAYGFRLRITEPYNRQLHVPSLLGQSGTSRYTCPYLNDKET